MPINPQTGAWMPDVSEKQLEIMRACRKPDGFRKYIFVASEKYTGKTIGCANAVVDHAWNVKDARICVISTTIGAGDDSGIWTEITDRIIPQWVDGNFGLDWWRGKDGKSKKAGGKMKGASKKLYCDIRNKFGGRSYLELNSLQDERDVEKLFFNRYFSMIYWGELQNYKEKKTFTTLTSSLRMPDLTEQEHVLLADGNPSEEGEDSWQYKLWFVDRIDPELPEEQKPMQDNLKLITLTLDDNPYLSERRKLEIKSSYADDPDLHARYVLGKWVKASTNSLFMDVFKSSIHVVGDRKSKDSEILLPEDNCSELFCGWDYGGVNPAFVIGEQCWRTRIDLEGNERGEESVFKWLDEIVLFDQKDLALSEFTEMVMKKREQWEKFLGRKIRWLDYSDMSALNFREPISNRFHADEIYSVSDGAIKLIGVDKAQGSVARRIRLWRRLLHQQRMIFSAAKCPILVEVNKGLKRGSHTYSIARNNPFKHPFDAAGYALMILCWDEICQDVLAVTTAGREPAKMVSMRL